LPPATGKYPAVIALHGSGGAHRFASDPARMLAEHGFVVFIVHYFDRTGTPWADRSTIQRHFTAWMQTIQEAITFAGSHPRAEPKGVALLGFSLGAYLALSVASADERVSAVVEFFGGVPEELEAKIKRMPPVLVLHGTEDPVVAVSEAERLRRLLERTATPHQVCIYPGAAHGFSGPTLLDAAMRTLRFLNEHARQRNRAA
jgi:dienelactone hydrolase